MADGEGEERQARRSDSGSKRDPCVQMESVYDKLCSLDYQKKFLSSRDEAPFHRWQFAVPPENPSVQFSLFLDVCAWLMAETTGDETFFRVDKFDDPNTSVNKLLLALRKLEYGMESSASKLKQAHGEATVNVLEFLVTKTVAKKIKWRRPEYIEEAEEEAEVDEKADLGAVEDTVEAIIEDEAIFKEEAFYTGGTGTNASLEKQLKDEEDLRKEEREILKSQVDPVVWQTEVERVGPRLRAAGSKAHTTAKEWRSHIDQTKEHEVAIQDLHPSTQKRLESLRDTLIQAKDKIFLKENYINKQFDEKKKSYQTIKSELDSFEKSLQTTTERCNTLTNDLGLICDQLEEMKGDMTHRGNSMTDTSPLVQIKHALKQLKHDIVSFDLQIGVVNHALLQQKLRHGNLNADTPGFKMRGKTSSSSKQKNGLSSHLSSSRPNISDDFHDDDDDDDDDDLFAD